MTDKERLSIGLLTDTDNRPIVIYDLQNGQQTKLYNHNIKKVWVKYDNGTIVDIKSEETEGYELRWQYDSLRVDYPVNADNTYKTLLNAKYGKDKENQLHNEYTSAMLGILPEEYKAKYLAFLQDRIDIRTMIDNDFNQL